MSAANAANAAAKQFSSIEELGFMLANYLRRKHPLAPDTMKAEVYDKDLDANFTFTRKGDKVYVAPAKQQKKRVSEPGPGETPDNSKEVGKKRNGKREAKPLNPQKQLVPKPGPGETPDNSKEVGKEQDAEEDSDLV